MTKKTLIIIPTFNEAENIGRLTQRLMGMDESIHVLVVDDASPDGTADIVKAQGAASGGRLNILKRTGKGGRGSAVLEGFRIGLTQGYELLFEMDADFSHNPEEIPSFLRKIDEGYDMVLGSRYLPESKIFDWGPKRTFFSKWANVYARAVLGIPITDYTNGYRCYTRKAVEALDMGTIEAKGYVVLSEVAYQLYRKGLRIGEVPTIFVNRRRGISNLGWHEIKEAFLSVLRIRWKHMTKREGKTQ
jgi:glycosyltransferase involved in cell wall biosynthesis